MARKPSPPVPELEDDDWLNDVGEFTPDTTAFPYPLIQFNHGDSVFEIPLDYFIDDPEIVAALPDHVQVHGRSRPTEQGEFSKSGGKEPFFRSPALHLAIVALRDPTYYRKEGDRTVYAPANHPDPIAAGFRSRLHVLVVCAELWAAGYRGLTVLTLKSSSVGDFYGALKALDAFIKNANRVLTKRRGTKTALPRYAFFTPLVCGKRQDAGSSGKRTPIECALPTADITLDDVRGYIIPAEVRDLIQDQAEQETAAWLDAAPAHNPADLADDNGNSAAAGMGGYAPAGESAPPSAVAPLGRVRVQLAGAIPDLFTSFQGQTLGAIARHADGPNFFTWLVREYDPANAGESKLVATVATYVAQAN